VVAVAEEMAKLNRIDPLDMTGSRWELVFTESMASSSGKIGPFVCRTEQVGVSCPGGGGGEGHCFAEGLTAPGGVPGR